MSGVFVQLSGVLKRVAVKLSKTCNDLRLLSSGPRAGFDEINLPARQAGSSHHAGQGQPGDPGGGQPGRLRGDRQRRHRDHGRRGRAVAAQRLRADHRALAVRQPRPPGGGRDRAGRRCIDGITANRELLRERVANSIGLVTALSPRIGYENATDVAQEALLSGRGVAEIVEYRGLLTRAQIDDLLSPAAIVNGSRV